MLNKFLKYFLTGVLIFTVSYQVNAQTFSDVQSNHSVYNAIENLVQDGIINGYSDNTFRPDNSINRVEFLKVLLLGSEIDVEEASHNAGFPDVISNSWYAKYVIKAKDKGIIKGNPDGHFYPNNQVNFAEALKMLTLANQVKLKTNLTNAPFADVPKDAWYAIYFDYAKNTNIITKNSSEKVNPGKKLNRGEAAELIFLFRNSGETIIETVETTEKQIATYYADSLEGNSTASGEIFDQEKLTAAHKTLPFGTKLKVTNLENNESVIVTINDRGPFASDPSYVLDLSKSAFQAISPLSRGKIEIKYEILNSENSTAVSKTLAVSESTVENDCNINHKKKSISTDFYENIVLDKDLPNIFLENEVYEISGKIKDGNVSVATAFLINASDKNEEYRFESPLSENGFTIPVHFRKAGKYNLGILKGESGQSFITEITIIEDTCSQKLDEASQSPTDLSIEYKNNETLITWKNHTQQLSRISFTQGNREKTYIINNHQEKFKIPYKDFADFQEGDFSLKISGANSTSNFSIDQSSTWAASEEKTFSAVKHHQVFNLLEGINTTTLPETYVFEGNISFSGSSKKVLDMEASIILPNGLVEKTDLSAADFVQNNSSTIVIPANTNFSFDYTPKTKGTHILEINKDNGFALINMPIYEQGTIPLIPDAWDINPHYLENEFAEINIENLRKELLQRINQSRTEFQSGTIETDDKLNKLAQARAEDMAANNYLEHKNLQGLYANDLKTNYGIKSNVSENIAKDTNISFTHSGLMRSAIHRANIINQKWTRVGLGIALDSEGYLIVVEEFSEDELDINDLPQLREQIISTINQKRTNGLVSEETLEQVAQEWSEKLVNKNEIWFEDSETGIALSYLISTNLSAGKQSASTIVKGYLDPILEQIGSNETIPDEKWINLGIGITQNNDGTLNITLIYAN